MSEPSEVWLQSQQAQAASPLLLALFDDEDRLREANPAFRRAWALPDLPGPTTWLALAQQAVASGAGPKVSAADLVRAQALRARLPQQAYEQEWTDGRWFWWVNTRTAAGWLWCVGSDISALGRGGRRQTGAFEGLSADARTTAPLDRDAGRRVLQGVLADARAWPLAVVLLRPGVQESAAALAGAALSSIRREDACAADDGSDLLLLLPMAGPAQSRAVLARLLERCTGTAGLTQAGWGETAEAVVGRARALCTQAGLSPTRLAQDG